MGMASAPTAPILPAPATRVTTVTPATHHVRGVASAVVAATVPSTGPALATPATTVLTAPCPAMLRQNAEATGLAQPTGHASATPVTWAPPASFATQQPRALVTGLVTLTRRARVLRTTTGPTARRTVSPPPPARDKARAQRRRGRAAATRDTMAPRAVPTATPQSPARARECAAPRTGCASATSGTSTRTALGRSPRSPRRRPSWTPTAALSRRLRRARTQSSSRCLPVPSQPRPTSACTPSPPTRSLPPRA
mmetsp:Transcript_28705/g.66199  ORF Transcript_28705/g.66199 Transcript_28705/m.66199 type:complete len:253 (+) Transcript_28705:5998-6756(+)